MPARRELQPRDRLEVAGDAAPGSTPSRAGQLARAARARRARRAPTGRRAAPRVARGGASRTSSRPLVDALGADARGRAGSRARSRRRCARPARPRAVARVGRRRAPARSASCSASRCASAARSSSVPSMSKSSSSRSCQRRELTLERGARLEALGERGDQLRRALDVVELDHLDRRVHVAQRDRDDAGGDAGAR